MKLYKLFFLFLCGILSQSHLLAMDISVYNNDFEMDELDVIAEHTEWIPPHLRAPDCTPVPEIVEFLTSPPILAQFRLQSDLYLFTNPINIRSLLDYPTFTLHYRCFPECWQVNMWAFYNQTTKGNYTKEGTTINTYLNLNDANLLRDIDEDRFGIDIPLLVSLFGVLKIQQRRGGFMLGGYRMFNTWNLEFKTPAYYLENNFFITDEEKNAIERSGIFNNGSEPSEEVNESEIRKHLISDQVGIGDTRISLGNIIIDNPRLMLNVGMEATIPTAFAFAKGLLGSDFKKNSDHPPFDLLQIFNICDQKDFDQVQQITLAFLTSAFDKLSANLLQTGMGNNGHFGFALFTEKHLFLPPYCAIATRAALEYFLPGQEKRFYILKKFPADFLDRDYTSQDPVVALDNLLFLNTQLIDTFIPKVHHTNIHPGFLFKLSTAFYAHMGCNWAISVGYDLWWQDKEKLGKIKALPRELALLRTDIAVKPGAFQNKLFGSVSYNREGECFDWCVNLYADDTFSGYGIGRDFTATLQVSLNF